MAAHSDYYCNKLSNLWKNLVLPLPEQLLKEPGPVASFSQQQWYRYSTWKAFHITNFHLWDHFSENLCREINQNLFAFVSLFWLFTKIHWIMLIKVHALTSHFAPTSLLVFLSDEEWLNSSAQQNISFHACCVTWDWLLDYCYRENRIGGVSPQETAILCF